MPGHEASPGDRRALSGLTRPASPSGRPRPGERSCPTCPPPRPGRRPCPRLPGRRPPAPSPSATDLLVDIASGLAASTALVEAVARHDPLGRRPVRLLATDRYEAWVIGWTTGQRVELHDHGNSVGVIAVTEGTLTEVRPDRDGRRPGWAGAGWRSGPSTPAACTSCPWARSTTCSTPGRPRHQRARLLAAAQLDDPLRRRHARADPQRAGSATNALRCRPRRRPCCSIPRPALIPVPGSAGPAARCRSRWPCRRRCYERRWREAPSPGRSVTGVTSRRGRAPGAPGRLGDRPARRAARSGEFATGHPLFAVSFPLDHLESLALRGLRRAATPVVLYGASDEEARLAVERLARLGAQRRRPARRRPGRLGGRRGRAVHRRELAQQGVRRTRGRWARHALPRRRGRSGGCSARAPRPVVLDARRFEEYRTMSIPGGVSVPGAELVLVRASAPVTGRQARGRQLRRADPQHHRRPVPHQRRRAEPRWRRCATAPSAGRSPGSPSNAAPRRAPRRPGPAAQPTPRRQGRRRCRRALGVSRPSSAASGTSWPRRRADDLPVRRARPRRVRRRPPAVLRARAGRSARPGDRRVRAVRGAGSCCSTTSAPGRHDARPGWPRWAVEAGGASTTAALPPRSRGAPARTPGSPGSRSRRPSCWPPRPRTHGPTSSTCPPARSTGSVTSQAPGWLARPDLAVALRSGRLADSEDRCWSATTAYRPASWPPRPRAGLAGPRVLSGGTPAWLGAGGGLEAG